MFKNLLSHAKKIDKNKTIAICLLILFSLISPQANTAEFPNYTSIKNINFPLLNTNSNSMPRRLIVTVTSSEKEALLSKFQAKTGERLTMIRKLQLPNRFLYGFKQGKTKTELMGSMTALKSMPGVYSVEEDIILRHAFTPDDTRYNEQWSLHEATGGIQANTAWDQSTGSNTVVAVLDTGYTNHQDLVKNILQGFDFISDSFIANDGGGRDSDAHDPGDWLEPWDCGFFNPSSFVPSSWHGTHVSGSIAAETHNSIGISGVAYNTRIVPVRVLGKCGGYLSDIADAIVWASGGQVSGVPSNLNPAHVISMSLGASGSCSSTFQTAINQAIANGSSVIAAAGNSQQNASNHQPSNCNGVISVASSDRQGNLAYYSNYGNVTLAAPGGSMLGSTSGGILSTLNTGSRSPEQDTYTFYQGTSMAAPHVAGTAALIYQLAPNTTPAELTQILTSTARTPPGNCSGCGAGIINATAAIASLLNMNQTPVADFDFTTTELTAYFTDTSSDFDGSITSWEWAFGDEGLSTDQNPQYTFSTDGDYQVTLTATDDSGASNTKTKTVSVISETEISSNINLSHQWARLSSRGRLRVRLLWSDAMGSRVDIYLNGENVERTRNDGQHTNRESGVTGSTFTYQLCEKDSIVCSNEHTVEF
jgi:serine protease